LSTVRTTGLKWFQYLLVAVFADQDSSDELVVRAIPEMMGSWKSTLLTESDAIQTLSHVMNAV
jgi:hypothetical protein